jgi:hypothetical protein
MPSSWCSPEIRLHLLLRAHIKDKDNLSFNVFVEELDGKQADEVTLAYL